MMVLINVQNGIFKDRTPSFFPELDCYTFDFVFADFNKDGLKDIYLCNFRGEDMLLLKSK